ncbi:hypothetical protein I5K44_26360 [Pseudomonas aeruginosa]|nr:hypothetical protein [Pseudomonas aeruginosa]MBH8769404.1 hypothetical protein [Pseudomonas aeruginosa]MBH9130802.1 hypothetical protein [Pseudomonas aeruginosa]MBH9166460.1 hypothetical protein [Pseudomonas aeruginosa]
MDIVDLFPPPGHIQQIYCNACSAHLDLTFEDFNEDVSGVQLSVSGLPMLKCPECESLYLPSRSRFALIDLHKQAIERNSNCIKVQRRKTNKNYGFTKVPFQYDSDDHAYIPGLWREFDEGFLTPVFFNKEVLLKYDVHPSYRVTFASSTYGSIWQGDDFHIPFGINRHGRLVMWLGDIAQLPESEQFYLRSENVQSDHSIGSEFYDGQIECKFTDRTLEDQLFEQRSRLLDACFGRFGQKIAHLEKEVLDLAISIRRPVVDTEVERRNVADALNKVYLESFDNKALENILSTLGQDASKLGSLKRLQKLLETVTPGEDVAGTMSPLYVLYDLRVAYSHLTSRDGKEQKMCFVKQRLKLSDNADLYAIYDTLLLELRISFEQLANMLK